jgi:hypothetical protein
MDVVRTSLLGTVTLLFGECVNVFFGLVALFPLPSRDVGTRPPTGDALVLASSFGVRLLSGSQRDWHLSRKWAPRFRQRFVAVTVPFREASLCGDDSFNAPAMHPEHGSFVQWP